MNRKGADSAFTQSQFSLNQACIVGYHLMNSKSTHNQIQIFQCDTCISTSFPNGSSSILNHVFSIVHISTAAFFHSKPGLIQRTRWQATFFFQLMVVYNFFGQVSTNTSNLHTIQIILLLLLRLCHYIPLGTLILDGIQRSLMQLVQYFNVSELGFFNAHILDILASLVFETSFDIVLWFRDIIGNGTGLDVLVSTIDRHQFLFGSTIS
mmetsp:Transcript_27429/g.42175  ORF Transcript_27429/g.42175 Transcript_27429/m.42175 type:complete len:209 (-) Transcript_27429:763-1389(-)